MILYLLLPALILGNVESQTVNVTEDESSIELNRVDWNQTFNESSTNNSTMKPDNVTSSSYKDEMRLIEEELQHNQTSTVITEDEESFQDQEDEFLGSHCQANVLAGLSHSFCGDAFRVEMTSISTENWCVLEIIKRPYYDMTVCMQSLTKLVGCYYPNPTVQDFFISIHSRYFHNCSKEELHLVDTPQGLVVALTLIPVSLIPILVYLVVWKSKVQE